MRDARSRNGSSRRSGSRAGSHTWCVGRPIMKANPVPESRASAPTKLRYWIVKFAPFRTSWSDIVRNGTFTLRGVRSAAARRSLSQMQIDDPVLFYDADNSKRLSE